MKRSRAEASGTDASSVIPPTAALTSAGECDVSILSEELTDAEINDLLKLYRQCKEKRVAIPMLNTLIQQAYAQIRRRFAEKQRESEANTLEESTKSSDSKARKRHKQLGIAEIPEWMKAKTTDTVVAKGKGRIGECTIVDSRYHWPQLAQLKGQMTLQKWLCAGAPMAGVSAIGSVATQRRVTAAAMGSLNPHAAVRTFKDPLLTSVSDSTYHSSALSDSMEMAKEMESARIKATEKSDAFLRDGKKGALDLTKDAISGYEPKAMKETQSIEQLAFGMEMARLKRMRMAAQSSAEGASLLQLDTLQRKMRKRIRDSDLKERLSADSSLPEALLDPKMFVRRDKSGLHFEPSINTANHPPHLAASSQTFPFHFVGQK